MTAHTVHDGTIGQTDKGDEMKYEYDTAPR